MTEMLRISAQADYAIRAVTELATAPGGSLVAAETIADRQQIPVKFLLAILNDLRRAGILESRRGHRGGYRLVRPTESLTLSEVIAAVDVAVVEKPWMAAASPTAVSVHDVWASLRTRIDRVLDETTIADILAGE